MFCVCNSEGCNVSRRNKLRREARRTTTVRNPRKDTPYTPAPPNKSDTASTRKDRVSNSTPAPSISGHMDPTNRRHKRADDRHCLHRTVHRSSNTSTQRDHSYHRIDHSSRPSPRKPHRNPHSWKGHDQGPHTCPDNASNRARIRSFPKDRFLRTDTPPRTHRNERGRPRYRHIGFSKNSSDWACCTYTPHWNNIRMPHRRHCRKLRNATMKPSDRLAAPRTR